MEQGKQEQPGEEIHAIASNVNKIMNLMEESKETVTALQNNVTENENSLSSFQDQLEGLKESHNNNVVALELNEKFKSYVKEKNKTFLGFAQIVYAACQGLYTDIGKGKSEWQGIEEKLSRLEAIVLEHHDNHAQVKKELVEKLQHFTNEKVTIECNLSTETQKKTELQLEVEKLRGNNEMMKCVLQTKQSLFNAMNDKLLTDIANFKMIMNKIDEELLQVMNEIKIEAECANNGDAIEGLIQELDVRFLDLKADVDGKTKILKEFSGINSHIKFMLEETEKCSYRNQDHQTQHRSLLIGLQNRMVDIETKALDNLTNHNAIIQRQNALLVTRKDGLLKLQEENSKLEENIVHINKELTDLKLSSGSMVKKTKVDYKKEIDTLENDYLQVKTVVKHLKRNYAKEKADYEEMRRKEQKLLNILEADIKKQNEAINEVTTALLKYKNEQNMICLESKNDEKVLNEINEEIKALRVKHEKLLKIRYKPNKIKPKQSTKELKHWDSDTSLVVDSPVLLQIRQKKHKLTDKVVGYVQMK